MRSADKAFDGKKPGIGRTKRILRTYSLLRELSSINGPDITPGLLDRAMYNSETLPPLGGCPRMHFIKKIMANET